MLLAPALFGALIELRDTLWGARMLVLASECLGNKSCVCFPFGFLLLCILEVADEGSVLESSHHCEAQVELQVSAFGPEQCW